MSLKRGSAGKVTGLLCMCLSSNSHASIRYAASVSDMGIGTVSEQAVVADVSHHYIRKLYSHIIRPQASR